MSDLISRKKAIRALQELDMLKESRWFPEVDQSPVHFVERMFIEAENSINSLPSAEPERVAKVKRLERRSDTGMTWTGVCSCCGTYTMQEMNYCYHCGARLEWDE